MSALIIEQLGKILQERKSADPGSSYVASLYDGGLEAIIAKIKEESKELIEAAGEHPHSGRDNHLIHETADLWFHTLVLLVSLDQDPTWVLEELEQRFGTSGIEEKANRE